jgi:exodeoxyribonuclease V alpha subunit
MSRQLRYGTNVIYDGKVAKIIGSSKTDDILISILPENNKISVKKTQLKAIPHDKGELIKYKNVYYIIADITLDSGKVPSYKLSFINKKIAEEIVKSSDSNIVSVEKTKQERIITFLKFLDRYNSTVSFLNKKRGNIYKKLDKKKVDEYMEDLFVRCKLKMTQLNKVENTFKKTHDTKLEITNIFKNPFNFITQDYQIIGYDKAENICNEYNLVIDFKVKIEKWSYDLFLRENNAFYIPKWLYERKLQEFCERRNENHINYTSHIDKIIIDKKIEKEKDKFGRPTTFKTTEYLLNLEKKMTDLMMDLFHDTEYDIPSEKINELINLYEERVRSVEGISGFTLEKEQRQSVISSVQNKFSVITGPPGTGKTEILKCINFVLFKLYKEEHPVEDEDEEEELEMESTTSEDLSEDLSESFNDYESDDESISQNYYCDANKFVNPKKLGLIAPTGLAYVNMQRSQKAEHHNINLCGTCHRTLYHTIPNIKKCRRECKCQEKCKYNFDIKMIEIDETSMMDSFVFYDILKACKYFNSRLIMLGDVEQLPSIGPGKILHQIIKSEVFSVTKLTKIKRQNAGALVNNILKMSKQVITAKDFTDETMVLLDVKEFILPNGTINENRILELISEYNLNKRNTKFISCFKKETFVFNTKKINNILQEKFNPLSEDWELDIIPSNNKYENSFAFRRDDRIVRTENDNSSEKMRANGEEAEILDFDGRRVTIQYSGAGDKPEKIGIDDLYENFILNYSVTIHKAQGSQYDNVVFFIDPKQTITEKKSIYTAISRARERCIIIANSDDFVKLQSNNKKIDYKVSLFMEESDNYEF